MDIDRPVEPIDPAEDARVLGRLRQNQTISFGRMLVALLQPALGAAGALVLGQFLGAPVIALIGMAVVWVLAWTCLFAIGSVLVAGGLVSLLRPGKAPGTGGKWGRRVATLAFAAHAVVFVSGGAVVGFACAIAGDGRWLVGAVAMALLGAVLAALGWLAGQEAG